MQQRASRCTFAAMAFAADPKATPEEARKFINDAEQKLLLLGVDAGRADWIKSTYITDDTEAIAAKLDEKAIAAAVDYAKQATRFDGLKLDPVTARKIKLLKLSLTLATPADPKESEELTRIVTGMEGTYGKGKYCPSGPESCKDLEELSKILAESRDPKALQDAWTGWHAISKPIRKDFVRYVDLANKGARQLGFKDNGAMWRSKYDMAPDDFAKELDRLWEQVKPLYLSLHAYVRNRLREKYGDAVPATGAIPANLLGNMWAQDWDNIYPLIAPANADPGYDLTALLKKRNTDWKQMVKYGEGFFTSLGFAPLPADVLGALALPQAEGPRRGVPRQRLGCRYAGRRAPQDVHPDHGRGFPHGAPRTGPQLLSARLLQAAAQLPRQRQRWLPRSRRRHHRALHHARIPGEDRAARQRAGHFQGHRAAAAQGAGEDRVPALRTGDRSVALEGILRRDPAREIQRDLVAAAPEVSGRRAAGGSQREPISIPPQNITWPPTCPTCATSWPTFCSSSSTARCRRPPDAPGR